MVTHVGSYVLYMPQHITLYIQYRHVIYIYGYIIVRFYIHIYIYLYLNLQVKLTKYAERSTVYTRRKCILTKLSRLSTYIDCNIYMTCIISSILYKRYIILQICTPIVTHVYACVLYMLYNSALYAQTCSIHIRLHDQRAIHTYIHIRIYTFLNE